MDIYTKRPLEDAARRMPAVLWEGENVSDVTADVVLSDYQPEVLRMLRVRVTPAVPDTYLSPTGAEISGTVDYTVLYCGNDGALYSVTHTAEYRCTMPAELPADACVEEGVVCDAVCIPELPTCRVTGPRKLSLRCRLRTRLRITGTRAPGARIEADAEEWTERLTGGADCMRTYRGVSEPYALADEIPCEGESADLRVIDASGEVLVSEADAASGAVDCRGEVHLRLLCCKEEASDALLTLQRKLPFRIAVPVEGAEVNCACRAEGVCRDLQVTVEDGRIQCDVGVVLTAHAERNEHVAYIKDLYAVGHGSENVYRDEVLRHLGRCVSSNFTFSSTLSAEELGLRGEEKPVEMTAVAYADRIEDQRGRPTLVGRYRCSILLFGAGEWRCEELELPLRYEMNAEEGVPAGFDAQLQVLSCRIRSDGEQVTLDAEIGVSGSTWSTCTLHMLSEARFTEAVPRAEGRMTVCYPSREDTLWSVAKRYRCPIREIVEHNGITGAAAADAEDSLAGMNYLLV